MSRELLNLAKDLWMWCLERNIHITAQHLPGVMNHIADAESRTMRDRLDWKLNPVIFRKIDQTLGPLEVDLFASILTNQCQVYFSWRPDPYAAATDAFLQDWSQLRGHANPPWCLIGKVLTQVQTQRAQIVLLAPVWKTQPWYPLLLSMAVGCPYLVKEDMEIMLNQDRAPMIQTQLAVWNISGRDTETKSFRRRLPLSCSNHGGKRPISLTTHSSADGIAGVREADPFSGPITDIVNFLATLHQQGYQYNSINSYRSAISSVHEKVDGYNIGQHPTVTRLKGIFHDRPPLPRYTSTWNVDSVLSYIRGLGSNQDLSLKQITWKTTMLLALTRPSRSADLANLYVTERRYTPEGVVFYPHTLAKQSHQGKPVAEFFFPSFMDDIRLCPATLRVYEERTQSVRAGESRLLLSFIQPHRAVTSSSIARWLKSLLTEAEVDTAIFRAHSIRGASSSIAANMGVTTNDILKAADWSSESVFQKFYYKSCQNPTLAERSSPARKNLYQ